MVTCNQPSQPAPSAILAETIRLDLPATYQHLSILGTSIDAFFERLQNIADKETAAYQVKLAAHEACTNIINHAYGIEIGEESRNPDDRITVEIALMRQPCRVVVDLFDHGQSFELSKPELPNQNEIQTRGYGLYLIHQLMDEVIYEPAPGQNHWRLVKRLIES